MDIKIDMVHRSDTVIDPRAMVIKAIYTSMAYIAVPSPWIPDHLAKGTKLVELKHLKKFLKRMGQEKKRLTWKVNWFYLTR